MRTSELPFYLVKARRVLVNAVSTSCHVQRYPRDGLVQLLMYSAYWATLIGGMFIAYTDGVGVKIGMAGCYGYCCKKNVRQYSAAVKFRYPEKFLATGSIRKGNYEVH